MPHPPRHSGFSLVELIVVIVLVGVISVFTSMLVLPMVGGFLTARTNAEHVAKAQAALLRLEMEITAITNVVGGNKRLLVYNWIDAEGAVQRSHLRWRGRGKRDPVYLNDQILIAEVQHFNFLYYSKTGETFPRYLRGRLPTPLDTVSIGIGIDFGSAGSAYTNQYHLRNVPERNRP